MKKELPEIDVVVIGLNGARFLRDCLQHVLASGYPAERMHVFYSDTGSKDDSVAVASGFDGVEVIALQPEHPSPGLGRNAGWRAGRSEFVQFVDCDTYLEPGWMRSAAAELSEREDLAAVSGRLRERFPEASVYNWIADREWNAPAGEVEAFGGNVMVRRSALEQTDGFDASLPAGEEPDLSLRMRLSGWKLAMLDEPMGTHDIATQRFGQYWKRCRRSGYAFANVVWKHRGVKQGLWRRELMRIIVRGGLAPLSSGAALLSACVFHPLLALLALPGVLLLFLPYLFRIGYIMRHLNVDRRYARKYALHCSLVVLPGFAGVVRFLMEKLKVGLMKKKCGDSGSAAGIFLRRLRVALQAGCL